MYIVERKLWNFPSSLRLYSFLSHSPSLLGPRSLLSTFLTNRLTLRSFFIGKNRISHWYETAGNAIILFVYILIFKFLDSRHTERCCQIGIAFLCKLQKISGSNLDPVTRTNVFRCFLIPSRPEYWLSWLRSSQFFSVLPGNHHNCTSN
jgi:hypothetical protein